MGVIKFGTDGWRDIIAENFTFENLEKVTNAYANYMFSKIKTPEIVIGFDMRFMSEKYAGFVAQKLCDYGFNVKLFDKPVPTPLVSWAIKNFKYDGGIVITSSHNPYLYNGFKVKNSYGSGFSKAEIQELEKFLYVKKELKLKKGVLEKINFDEKYVEFLKKIIDIDLIMKSKIKIVLDPMCGSGIGYIEKVLDGYKFLEVINNKRDPLFGGVNPEPIEQNLKKLMKKIKNEKSDIGLVLDGDADRLGVVDNKGFYMSSHKVFSLILLHHIKYKKMLPEVIRTVSGTFLIDKIAKKYNLKLYETPVGFNNIAEIMIKNENAIGGEESGGFGYSYYLPERDGVFSGLLMLEFLAREKRSLRKILKAVDKEYGKLRYGRTDVHFKQYQRKDIERAVFEFEKKLIYNNKKIIDINKKDGTKFILGSDEWILFRFSGTEPLLRIYCEAGTKRRVESNLKYAVKIIQM